MPRRTGTKVKDGVVQFKNNWTDTPLNPTEAMISSAKLTDVAAAWAAVASSRKKGGPDVKLARAYAAMVLDSEDKYRIREIGHRDLAKVAEGRLSDKQFSSFFTHAIACESKLDEIRPGFDEGSQ